MRLNVASVLFLIAPAAANACLPAPLGATEPPPTTVEQRAETLAQSSKTIVYGVLTREIANGQKGQLRIIHVYKGTLRSGIRVAIKASWGFDPPMCAGMLGSPPPLFKGAYGVFAWSGEPEANSVSDESLAAMFKLKLIRPASGG